MNKLFYLSMESLTSAMRGNRILNSKGIASRVEKTTNPLSRKGCGFSIVIYSEPRKVIEILEGNNIKVISVKER